MNRCGLLFLLTLVVTTSTLAQRTKPSSQPAARAEVLVLGVYHMANPGHDLFDLKADDVLASKRQEEIAQVIEVLKKFHPTKIAVEASSWNTQISTRYAEYAEGKHQLSPNEIEQIGFRLAKELGHKTVYPVDADGDFPWQRVVDYAKASGRSKELEAIMQEEASATKADNQYLASHTILQALLNMNADDRVAEDMSFYFRTAHFGEPGDWAGADLLADWFHRNTRIYSNITRLVDSPHERVLVIFGAGHLGWLRFMIASDPTLRLRKLSEFVN